MFEAHFNGKKKVVDFLEENKVSVDGTEYVLDQGKIDDRKYHLILENKSYNIELVSIDKVKKLVSLKINNNPYQINVKDKFDLLLSQLGMSDMASKKIKDLKAPMPGLVVDILVEPGQEVKEGDSLLILEAMKMENSLKSPVDGVVKAINVSQKNTVDKNQILLSFE